MHFMSFVCLDATVAFCIVCVCVCVCRNSASLDTGNELS